MTPVCDETRSAADPRPRVEHFALIGNAAQVYQLGCGDAAHRVEVLEQPEVRRREMAEVLSGGNEGLLDTASRNARRVLGIGLGDCHV
jgi:spermidine synthase